MALHFECKSSMERIEPRIWNEMAGTANPLLEWEYYHALEKSGAIGPDRGYLSTHIVAFDGDKPIALAPLFERDRAWVEFGDGGLLEFLTELTGLPYNHGLVGNTPFTPVPGYRFLHHPDVDPTGAFRMLLDYIDFRCQTQNLATARLYFVSLESPELHALLSRQGYLVFRTHYSYWINRNYQCFDDYLKSLKSSRRTKIRRELRALRDRGVEIAMIDGLAAPVSYFSRIFELYSHTWEKYMGPDLRPFLNRDFFRGLGHSFRHRCSFAVAKRHSQILGMALFYHKTGRLFGRYWGCYEELPFLHFASCYYYPIEFAIQNRMTLVDPGFGGEHKTLRGFEAVPVYHYIKFFGDEPRRLATHILGRMKIGVA